MRPDNRTGPARRAALALAAFMGVLFLTWVLTLVLFGGRGLTFLIPPIAAIAFARYAWVHAGDGPRLAARNILLSAVVFGGVGFAAGFFGPLIFAPGANQGPLLGIFITGPVGVITGATYAVLKSRNPGR